MRYLFFLILTTSLVSAEEGFFNKEFIFRDEDKIISNILSQEIITKKCSSEQWCEFFPKTETNNVKLIVPKFNFKNIEKYQKLSYQENEEMLKRVSPNETLEKYALFKKGQCPMNTAVAWLKKNESESRLNHINKMYEIYEEVKKCPNQADYEEMYLRQALYFYHQKNMEEAKFAISRALENINKERMRILYWAGVILEDTKYLEEVVEKYPYSYHAIEASEKTNKIPYFYFLIRPSYSLKIENTSFYSLIEKLLYFNKMTDADTLLRWNISNKNISNQEWFQIQRLLIHFNLNHLAINLVARLAYGRPEFINFQVLNLNYQNPYENYFVKHAKINNLDPYILMSLSKQESGFNSKAISLAKAYGLMQLLHSTAKHLDKVSKEDLFNPDLNIGLGAKYLSFLYRKYGQIEPALAAYNAGPNRVDKWLKIYDTKNSLLFMDLIPFKETRSYVSLILRNEYYFKNVQKFKEK